MADTYVTCSVSPCTVVIQLDSPLLSMDSATALTLCASIVGAWALGFVIRMIIKVINGGETETEKET